MFIGVGQMIAGYVYPNQADEINNAVDKLSEIILGRNHIKIALT